MRHCARSLALAAVVAAFAVAARPAGAGFSDILRRIGHTMGPVLLTRDVLARPGEEVTLHASLRSGLRLGGMGGVRLQFHLEERRIDQVASDADGDASVRWTAPAEPGNYRIRVRVKADDQPADGKAIAPAHLLVAVRKPDTPITIVDLDKTLVGSGFHTVLLGGGRAKPMDGSGVVLARLATTHTIVYLTHRPDFLGPTSKGWLASNGYPPGPVLTSTLGGLLEGSGSYKTQRLADLARNFKNLRVGIGDKVSDAQAYAAHGLVSILILHVDWSDDDPDDFEDVAGQLAALPASVHVVTNWAEVNHILFSGARRPAGPMISRLRAVAAELRRRGKD